MCEKNSSVLECLPITSYQDLLNFSPEIIDSSHPKKYQRSHPFKVIGEAEENCDYDFVSKDEKLNPRTLFCHDMKGGYLDDRFRFGNYSVDEEPYRFIHWSNIDTFVYFSHNFITIPPRQWIDAGHRNGVSVLGTIITEFKDGERICSDFLKDEATVMDFVQAIVKLTTDLQIDGWLVNIENKLTLNQVRLVVMLLKNLKDSLKLVIPHSEVIWYDAVTRQGELEWQNELNDLNKTFFDNCDGIFLNYQWTEERLENSLKRLKGEETRRFDIYVGVDVFGRGCFGGGGFNSNLALEVIRKKDLSTALFAPGWTHECDPSKEKFSFPRREYKFWQLLRPFLFTRGPLVDDSSPEFQTFFSTGCGQNCNDRNSWWLNMTLQEIQPSILNHPDSGMDASFFVLNCNDSEVRDGTLKQNHVIMKKSTKEWKVFGAKNIFPLFVCKINSSEEKDVEFQLQAKGSEDQVLVLRDSNGILIHLKAHGDEKASTCTGFKLFTFCYKLFEFQEINFIGILADEDSLEIRSFHIQLK